MTDERHDAEATATRKGRSGPIVAGPDAREAERPAESAKTDERHDAEATTTREGKSGPLVAGPDAQEAEKPARSAKTADESPGKVPQEAKLVTSTHAGGKSPTPGP
jgi:hypothetical protein